MFSIPIFAKASIVLGTLACAACAGLAAKPEEAAAPPAFYTVTAEIALARHQPRVAALQYATAAANENDPALLERATQVAEENLQPSLAEADAARWISVDPASLEAQRAAARAALALHQIERSVAHYRVVLRTSPLGTDAEFAKLETELTSSDNAFGARQVADHLVALFPASGAALRMQGFAALRADDPAAAVQSFTGALAFASQNETERRELLQALPRARVLSGDLAPLTDAASSVERDDTPANRLDCALLFMTARHHSAATQQLEILAQNSEYTPVALRLLGLIAFQEGHLDESTTRFAELLQAKKFVEDAFYYLALIADRRGDSEHALRLYAQVQSGENTVPALLRATALLHKHGAQSAAEELLDRLIEDEPRRAPEIVTARARMYADAGDLAQALSILQRGVLEYPDSVDLRYGMASLYEEQGRVPAALQELRDLLKARPDDPAAMNALGYTLADHTLELARARQLIERAYAAAPRNAAVLDSLGWVLFRQGHRADAETYLRIAYADERAGDIAAHLGEVLWLQGKQSEAERIWSEGSGVDADNRLLKETRRRLQGSDPAALRAPATPPAAAPSKPPVRLPVN